MKEATFIISNTDFSDWRMANATVEKIIISGTATFKQAKYSDIVRFAHKHVKGQRKNITD